MPTLDVNAASPALSKGDASVRACPFRPEERDSREICAAAGLVECEPRTPCVPYWVADLLRLRLLNTSISTYHDHHANAMKTYPSICSPSPSLLGRCWSHCPPHSSVKMRSGKEVYSFSSLKKPWKLQTARKKLATATTIAMI